MKYWYVYLYFTLNLVREYLMFILLLQKRVGRFCESLLIFISKSCFVVVVLLWSYVRLSYILGLRPATAIPASGTSWLGSGTYITYWVISGSLLIRSSSCCAIKSVLWFKMRHCRFQLHGFLPQTQLSKSTDPWFSNGSRLTEYTCTCWELNDPVLLQC